MIPWLAIEILALLARDVDLGPNQEEPLTLRQHAVVVAARRTAVYRSISERWHEYWSTIALLATYWHFFGMAEEVLFGSVSWGSYPLTPQRPRPLVVTIRLLWLSLILLVSIHVLASSFGGLPILMPRLLACHGYPEGLNPESAAMLAGAIITEYLLSTVYGRLDDSFQSMILGCCLRALYPFGVVFFIYLMGCVSRSPAFSECLAVDEGSCSELCMKLKFQTVGWLLSNLIFGILWYAYRYSSKGTDNPAWTAVFG